MKKEDKGSDVIEEDEREQEEIVYDTDTPKSLHASSSLKRGVSLDFGSAQEPEHAPDFSPRVLDIGKKKGGEKGGELTFEELKHHFDNYVDKGSQMEFLDDARKSGKLNSDGKVFVANGLARLYEAGGNAVEFALAAGKRMAMGDVDKAKEDYMKSARMSESDGDYDRALNILTMKLGNLPEAIALCTRASKHYKGRDEMKSTYFSEEAEGLSVQAKMVKEAERAREGEKESGLVKRVAAGVLAVFGLGSGLAFFSGDLTGAVVGLSSASGGLLGAVCLLVGVLGVVWLARR